MRNSHKSSLGLIKKLLSVSCVLALLFTYNNCGEKGFETKSDSNVEKIETRLATKHANKISPTFCTQSENYKCIHRIFSQDVENYEVDLDFPCLNINGSQLCIYGKQYGFNTGHAILECGDNCQTNYEYEEFSCYLDLKDDDSKYPISGESDNFEDALKKASDSCTQFVSGL